MDYTEFQHLSFTRRDHGVLLITIDRPEKMNATNARLHWELSKIWGVVNDDASVSVVVVTGAGKAFSVGGDLEMVTELLGDAERISAMFTETIDIVANMIACEKPIISAINGVAVGAGLTVAFMADISIMAEEARVTDGHAKLGVAAGDHAAICWPLLCGMAKAKYYLLTADFIDGREAERIGLVSKCVPLSEVMPKAYEVADKLAMGSQQANRLTKRALNGWFHLARPIFDSSAAMEMLCLFGADAREGVAAVREKRAPMFPSVIR
jgi:enoyl-CoA hydratase